MGMPSREPGKTSNRTAARRWYRFSYHNQRKGADRTLFPHQLRDGDAALFLAPVLEAQGYSYGGPIFNYPHPQQPPRELVPVNEAALGLRAHDLLLLTTRPPLDDVEEGRKARVLRSYTTLEDKIFRHAIRPHLARSTRSQIIVAEEHARAFGAVATRRNLVFRLYRRRRQGDAPSRTDLGACISRYLPHGSTVWHEPPRECSLSAAYLIFEKHAWPGGPALLAGFGMGGMETLVWAYLLRTRFSHLVGARRFVMAEIVERDVPEPPLTMGFADRWDVRLLTEEGPDGDPPVTGA